MRGPPGPVGRPRSSTHSYLFLLGDLLLWFGDDLLLFGQDHLDVAGRAHVGVDAAVSAIRAPPHLGGLVDLDVFDDQRVHIQALRTEPARKPVRTRAGQICQKNLRMRDVLPYLQLSVALGIFKHVQEELGALLGPASLSPAELFGLEKKTNVSSHFCVTGRVGLSPEGAQTND